MTVKRAARSRVQVAYMYTCVHMFKQIRTRVRAVWKVMQIEKCALQKNIT